MVSFLKPLLEDCRQGWRRASEPQEVSESLGWLRSNRSGDRARVNFFSDSVFHDEAPLLAGELLNEVKLRGEQSVSFA